MVKPHQVLFSLLAIGGLCVALMAVFPKKGIAISDGFVLHFPDINTFFLPDSTAQPLDVDSLLNSYTVAVDSTAIKDSIAAFNIQERKKLLALQFADNQEYLKQFCQALIDLKKGKRSKVRILHYGDSQIEGDRITSYIREQLQSAFGGTGPGMLPAKSFIPSLSIAHTQSENWLRYTVFGKRDTTVKHNHFGMHGIFSRFTPNRTDSNLANYTPTTAWVQFKPSGMGYSHVRRYTQLRMHYGNNKLPVFMQIFVDDVLFQQDSLPAKPNASALYTLNFGSTPKTLKLVFSGGDSPDFYGISLESASGVVVDNIAMRGSSGTIFGKISRSQLQYQFNKEPISLVIMQYGGNTVPYIDSEDAAEKYGNWMRSQISIIKKLLPNADIVFIGPSDMSIKEETNYVTYPFLPEVRDALKQAAFANGAAFWDVYEVMGGKNSMPSWVAAEPPLAGPDYIHFTPRGARKIAELFYKALIADFEAYQAAMNREKAALDATQPDTAKSNKTAENE